MGVDQSRTASYGSMRRFLNGEGISFPFAIAVFRKYSQPNRAGMIQRERID